MTTHDQEQTYRVPAPGDLVTKGCATLYRVVEVSTYIPEAGPAWRIVRLVSERSGRKYTAPLAHLYWPDKPRGEAFVVPWEVAYPPRHDSERDEPAERQPWGSDGLSAAFITWDAPIVGGTQFDPSSVAVCVAHDSQGRRFVQIVADAPGDRAGAYLDRNAAIELGAALLRLGGGMPV